MTTKTNKSFTKRLKVTRKGKILARVTGQNHFNSKESRSAQLRKKRSGEWPISNKDRVRFITKL
jgi:ribosomal protein L35